MTFISSVEDSILIFKFDNNKYNAISSETMEGLNEAVERVNSEEELKGLIITGEGRFFSSGFELGDFLSFKEPEDCLKWFDFEEKVMYNLFTCKKPVIAAVNGHATAAGMIVAMAADYRIVINNPKIKIGMTEIHIGLSITTAEAEIMKFGLDSDKNYRDVLLTGQLMNPEEVVQKGIFDELVADEAELLNKAKAKVCCLIDTPGRPFIMLKQLEKRQAAEYILEAHHKFDWNTFAKFFFNESVLSTLSKVKASMS
ncbi:MAG: hypothetical protein CVU90_14305 [Firmicutes bacterium HGW-Firmicutes-15]|nr:MAG: hypothetical protein CVU90_14305 [Firmicutes bacterium HGW-Firmicutes-15]